MVAVLYLALFWTGFPLAMTIIDLLAAIPKEADKNGNICVLCMTIESIPLDSIVLDNARIHPFGFYYTRQ